MTRDEFFLKHWRPLGNALTSGQVMLRHAVTRSQLRYWETAGILRPQLHQRGQRLWRGFDQEEEAIVRRLAYLMGEGMSLRGAVAKLAALERREEAMKAKPVEPATPVRWDDIFDPPAGPLGS